MDQELETLQRLVDALIEFGVAYGFQLLGAVIILIAGAMVARWVARLVLRLGERRNFGITLAKFFANVARVVVMVFVIIIALSKFGITISPLVAALSAVAFGSSLALAGPLSNYGAGLAIILGRPFVVGNTITALGLSGVVEEVRLAATYLRTEDGETVIIPNKEIVGQVLVNSYANRVVEMQVGISYQDDPDHAEQIIAAALAGVAEVVGEPAPQIGIQAFGDSAIVIAVRYWVPTERYFQVQFQANKAIWAAIRAAGIRIPLPQQELRILDNAKLPA
jgi:small conductance mechanosensitive channel